MITRHPETALVPYMRGELEGEERARVARHLEGCASCREAAWRLAPGSNSSETASIASINVFASLLSGLPSALNTP